MKTIYSIAKECQDYIEQNISFNRNKIPYGRLMFTDYDIVGNIKQLERLLIDFHSAIKGKYPSIATSLKENMDLYDNDPIIHISAITAIIDCICAIEQPLNGKRIFISHSSKDAQIVSNFMDHILCLGIGINRNDIFVLLSRMLLLEMAKIFANTFKIIFVVQTIHFCSYQTITKQVKFA